MDKRNETVDALRGFAALAVCLFHFTSAGAFQGGLMRPVAQYGVRGIDVFFVISGFIVPYALARSGYTLASWPRFMVKRLVRLEPPYLVSIAVVLAIGVMKAATSGRAIPDWTLTQIASHAGYLTAFAGQEWLSPVYWTLAIEFQFYLLMAVALPAILYGTPAASVAIVTALAALPLALPIEGKATIVPFLPVFAAGMLVFLLKIEKIGPARSGSAWR